MRRLCTGDSGRFVFGIFARKPADSHMRNPIGVCQPATAGRCGCIRADSRHRARKKHPKAAGFFEPAAFLQLFCASFSVCSFKKRLRKSRLRCGAAFFLRADRAAGLTAGEPVQRLLSKGFRAEHAFRIRCGTVPCKRRRRHLPRGKDHCLENDRCK